MDARAWDERYAAAELVWSATPNRFVEAELASLPPGRAVDLAAGAGRHPCWLGPRCWPRSTPAVLYTAEEVLGDLDGERFEVERAERVARPVQVADAGHKHPGEQYKDAYD